MIENSSGRGLESEVPEEIIRWSWGAFFLTGIWGIGNRSYVALLGFVPILNIFMMVILGFQGRKLAWKNKRWKSIEHFEQVQKRWDYAGYAALAIYLFYALKGLISLF
ncbi:MAG TPA: hypothetical protein VK040_05740 [Balneolaceae bacterium]|nr:hypothetical protein [Balneolaceae bacterium]